MGVLYLVSTPIGNMSDITLRAIEILQSVDIILCEDTRKTGMLLKRIKQELTRQSANQQTSKLVSFHDHNEEKRIPQVLELLKQGKKVALVSDAGTPLISDPGYKLLKRIRELAGGQIRIEVIPGPSAVTAALISSGFPPYPFLFLGYLPKKELRRKKFLQELQSTCLCKQTINDHPPVADQRSTIIRQWRINNLTIVAFESPYRLIATLKNIQEILGNIEIAVCRELTKLHEEILRDNVSKLTEHFEKVKPKGEITIVWNI